MKNTKVITLCMCITLCTVLLFNMWISKYGLKTTYYVIESSLQNGLRIVHLTDQHNSLFGNDNMKLVEKIRSEKPDLICITGDQINLDSDESDINQALLLISKLRCICPVYISYGNHEVAWKEVHQNEHIEEKFEAAGAIVLDYSFRDITINEMDIRIGGLYGYCLPDTYIGEYREDECVFLHELENTDRYTILLCHMPVCWICNRALDSWDIDLVLSGHVHGGQIRIPFIGGLYAPDMGWFPGKVKGIYSSKDGEKKMVLSSGLGSYDKLPRFNNVPEIVVVDLVTN